MTTVKVLPTIDGKFGPLNGPFTLAIARSPAPARQDVEDQDLLADLVGFVRTVVAGVSSYNRSGMETSSNLTSYASECIAELQAEAPDCAARLENLTIDCSGLPEAVRDHPIWRLDRAILAMLPGVAFID
jgi:hypothetical protein